MQRDIYPASVAKSPRLTIAHVTPYTWGSQDEVNEFAGRVSAELRERGHDVALAAPVPPAARCATRIGRSRRARDDPAALFGPGWEGERAGPRRPADRRNRPGDSDAARAEAARRAIPARCLRHARAAAQLDPLRRRPRPRPVCAERLLGGAAAFAGAQRRQLPRADRADPLDAGCAARSSRSSSADSTRAPSPALRPATSCSVSSPAPTSRCRAGETLPSPCGPAPGGPAGLGQPAAADRLLRPARSAAPCGSCCGRCASCRSTVAGRPSFASMRRSPRPA